jgi:tetratricopeptide (TPR) repeat protein
VALGGYNRAIRLYQTAIALGGADNASAAELLASLAYAQANAGLSQEAADSYSTAANLDYINAQELRRRAAEELLKAGEVDRALSIMGGMLRTLRWRKASLDFHGRELT